MKRVLASLGMVILAVAAGTGYYVYHSLKAGLPKLDGFVQVSGLGAPVQVYRNAHGVPSIWAEGEKDLYFATGYVMAQDRLFQMDLMRRAALGRLSEIIGEAGLEQDEESRIIGFGREARKLEGLLGGKTRDILESFSEGVNAYIESNKDNLAVEFDLLGYEPEQWKPWHTIAIARLVGWTLGMRIGLEVVCMYVRAKLGDELAERLFPARLEAKAMPLGDGPDGAEPRKTFHLPPMPDELRRGLASAPLPARLEAAIAAMGSNSWAVAGEKSGSGMPMLANDPHLALTHPSFWYIIHQHADSGLNVAGSIVPGTPTVLIGRNDRLAWGLTNLGADIQDFFLERLRRNEHGELEALGPDGTYKPVETVEESIKIRDGDGFQTKKLVVNITPRGPLVPGLLPESVQDYGLALAWPGTEATNELGALYKVAKASSFTEFRQALQSFGVAPQNFLYADRRDIGFVTAGWIPKRRGFDGRCPAPAFDSSFGWDGRVPFSLLPSRYGSDKGFLAIANQQPVTSTYPFEITTSPDPHYRASRIQKLLEKKERFSVRSMREMQLDATSPDALEMANLFVSALEGAKGLSLYESKALELLRDWDGRFMPGSEGALVFQAVYDQAMKELFGDELEGMYDSYRAHAFLVTQVFEKEIKDPASPFMDDRHTPKVKETREMVLRSAFKKAVADLVEKAGKESEAWTYSRFHVFERRHPMASGGWIFEKLFSRGPNPVRGSAWCIDATSSGLHPFRKVRAGPSMRMVVDFGENPQALHITATGGESGHFMSKYYDDMTGLWLNGRLMVLYMDGEDVRATSAHRLVLSP